MTNTTHFSEDLRYDYPLPKNSRVIDCGFYEGDFARRIILQHGCRVDAYEPVREWYERGKALIVEPSPLTLWHGAVGCWEGTCKLRIKGGMTGRFCNEGEVEETPLHLIDTVIGVGCDLLKLNIEGMEFEVLERMVKLGLSKLCRNIQVQFHTCAPDAEKRWRWIRASLLRTHSLTYDFPWCWENYRLND